jgi:IclR family acetate operon transcriptional repressor
VKKLREELARVRQQRYALDDEEDEVGLRCIGVPVFDQTGQAIAAVSVAGTVLQITRQNLRELVPIVIEAAASISRAFGYSEERRAG